MGSGRDGLTPDFRATDISLRPWGAEFRAHFSGRIWAVPPGDPGMHNVSNALIAIAIGMELDVPVDLIRKGLAAFTGVERRFHLRGKQRHHGRGRLWASSDRNQATLAAAKQGGDRRLVVLFQPHRYTRSRDLLEDFSHAFDQADRLVHDGDLCGRRAADSGVSGLHLARWFARPAIRR